MTGYLYKGVRVLWVKSNFARPAFESPPFLPLHPANLTDFLSSHAYIPENETEKREK